jgi:small subunit ribosomal protein S1
MTTHDSHDDDFEEKNDRANSEFARMLEDSFRGGSKKFAPGDKVRGEVLVAGKEEIFVSLGGGREGIVPRREMKKNDEPVAVQVGETLDLYVTAVKGGEIYLSPHPTAKNLADDLEDAFDLMLPVEGRVAEVVKGGVRVALQGGKLAFCPISQLDNRRTETGEEYVGQKFEFLITKFTPGGRDIVVSRRKLLEDQKELQAGSFLEEHKEGDVVPGRIMRLEKFGAFVEVAPGIEGLAHISQLSWSRVNDPSEVVQVGQDVKVKILKIERPEGARMKISLSIKEAGLQPWDQLPAQIRSGATVEGKVTRLAKFGAFIELAPGIEGLLPLGEMSDSQRVQRAEDIVKAGQTVQVTVKSVDPAARRISLSLRTGSDPDAAEWQSYQQQQKPAAVGFGTLGDQLRKAMEAKTSGKKR